MKKIATAVALATVLLGLYAVESWAHWFALKLLVRVFGPL